MILNSVKTAKWLFVRGKLLSAIKLGKDHFFLFIIFSLAYAFLAPNIFQQDWDSLMYAYWAEVNGISSIWGNHPLGHVILNSIYLTLSKLGYQGKALPVFILINSTVGGFAVALFFSLMKVLKISYLLSLGYAILFGASYSLWHYSGSADIYSISVLFLLLAWISLLHEVFILKARRLYLSGILASLGILSHQLNVVFLLAALIIIFFDEKDRWARFFSFYCTSLVFTFTGLIIFGYLADSASTFFEFLNWIRGYLGEEIYGSPVTLNSISVAGKTALQTFLVPTYGRARFIRIFLYLLLTLIIALGITQIKLLDYNKKTSYTSL